VHLYDPLLLAYVGDCNRRCRLGLNEHEREDLKQVILIKLYRVLPELKLEGRGRFRTWLWRLSYNACASATRSWTCACCGTVRTSAFTSCGARATSRSCR
jgi:DNA-directed RNA polymerase specialized sigma24 family protein